MQSFLPTAGAISNTFDPAKNICNICIARANARPPFALHFMDSA
jgi:hypothetical protein